MYARRERRCNDGTNLNEDHGQFDHIHSTKLRTRLGDLSRTKNLPSEDSIGAGLVLSCAGCERYPDASGSKQVAPRPDCHQNHVWQVLDVATVSSSWAGCLF